MSFLMKPIGDSMVHWSGLCISVETSAKHLLAGTSKGSCLFRPLLVSCRGCRLFQLIHHAPELRVQISQSLPFHDLMQDTLEVLVVEAFQHDDNSLDGLIAAHDIKDHFLEPRRV